MLSTQELTSEIQRILASGGEVEKERLVALADAYAMACARVQDKVNRCLECLRKGQKNEAVRQATTDPDLKAEFALVEFEEKDRWMEVCESLELPLPYLLDAEEIGSLIEELYAANPSLERLLTVFRRMSLGLAPLADRVRILRRIVDEDPRHDCWKGDLKTFERARLEELVQQIELADKRQDLRVLEALLAEVKSDGWGNPPPRAFVKRVERILQPHRQRLARDCYASLAERLRQAHARMDEPDCCAIFQEWEKVRERTGVEAMGLYADQAAPVREWLAGLEQARREEADYRSACAALEAALDGNPSQAELERVAARVLAFERGTPEILAARFNSRIEELQRAHKRTFALVLTGVVGVVLVLGVIVAASAIWYSRSHERNRWKEQIASALGKGDLEGAARLLEKVRAENPAAANSPEIQSLRAQQEARVTAEADRRRQYEACTQKVAQAGPDAPDEDALRRAGELAQTGEEKVFVKEWREKIQEARDKFLQAREGQYKDDVTKARTLLERAQVVYRAGEPGVEAMVVEAQKEADRLVRAGGVSQTLVAEAAVILKATEGFRKRVDEEKSQRAAADRGLEAVVQAGGRTLGDLGGELQKFSKTFPEHPLAAHFTRALAMARYWPKVEAWLRLRTQWGAVRLSDAKVCQDRLRQLEDYLKGEAGPYQAAALRYRDYLLRAAEAMPDGKLRGLDDLHEILDSPIIARALCVRVKGGQTLYIMDKEKDYISSMINNVVKAYRIRFIVDGAETRKEIQVLAGDVLQPPAPAPHILLVEALNRAISGFRKEQWETFHLGLAEIVRAHAEADPLLRARLMKMLLERAGESAPCLNAEIQALAKEFGKIPGDVAWMNPGDRDANDYRPQAERLLKQTKSFVDWIDRIERDCGSLADSLETHRPAGLLLGSAETVRLLAQAVDGDLCVLWAEGQEPPTFRKIGTVSKGKPAVDVAVTKAYPQGSPVFVRGR